MMYFTTMSSLSLFMNERAASSTTCHNNTWNFLSRSEGRRNSNVKNKTGINEIKVYVSVIKWDWIMSNFKWPKNREKLKFPVCFHKLRLCPESRTNEKSSFDTPPHRDPLRSLGPCVLAFDNEKEREREFAEKLLLLSKCLEQRSSPKKLLQTLISSIVVWSN